MLINYLMGIIAKNYGIGQVTHLIFAEVIMMGLLLFFIFKTKRNMLFSG
ncbi:MAG TPA: hypothetical protein PKW69_08950 [Niabella sp.]|nr:hypothetical protein [Niabella sp.]